jgi:hypothetical protein
MPRGCRASWQSSCLLHLSLLFSFNLFTLPAFQMPSPDQVAANFLNRIPAHQTFNQLRSRSKTASTSRRLLIIRSSVGQTAAMAQQPLEDGLCTSTQIHPDKKRGYQFLLSSDQLAGASPELSALRPGSPASQTTRKPSTAPSPAARSILRETWSSTAARALSRNLTMAATTGAHHTRRERTSGRRASPTTSTSTRSASACLATRSATLRGRTCSIMASSCGLVPARQAAVHLLLLVGSRVFFLASWE